MSGLTIGNPVTLTAALNSGKIIPGDTLLLRAGSYVGNFALRATGTTENHISILPYNGEDVIIVADMSCGLVGVGQAYWDFRNLKITNTNVNRTAQDTGSNPPDVDVVYRLRLEGDHLTAINCIIHDSGTLVAAWGKIPDVDVLEISDCIIFYGGWNAPDRGHGHGIYTSGDTIKIKNCIIFDMFGNGIQAYGEGDHIPLLKNINIENCIVFGAGSLWIAQTNILIGGSGMVWPDHCTIKNNCSFHRGLAGTGIQYGFGAAAYDGGTIQDNIVVGGQYSLYVGGNGEWADPLIVTGNGFYSSTHYDAALNKTDADYPDNTYSSGVPDLVRVYPSEYTNTLAHVAIFNGAGANSVSVDLTAVMGLSAGDSVKVISVQDLFVDIATTTLDENKCISVDMQAASHTVATPQGWTAPASTFPKFGCFVVEKA